MNEAQSIIDRVAAAVLYEGYILYPYRRSLKNMQRWTFGGVLPRAFCEIHPEENCTVQSECLVVADDDAELGIRVRFLQLVERMVAELTPPLAALPDDREPATRRVDSLTVGGETFHGWQEAVEREIAVLNLSIGRLITDPYQCHFVYSHNRTTEPLSDVSAAQIPGILIRENHAIEGNIRVGAQRLDDGVTKLTVTISNDTAVPNMGGATRDMALAYSFASLHTILELHVGQFISAVDPPPQWTAAAAACSNRGAWPVLVGEKGQRDTMLSAPIILYDYPEVAPESPGDLFDASEIDEILTLRVLTLTDDEKRQMAMIEHHTRSLLQRTEALDAAAFNQLHGTLRLCEPATEDCLR
ncbi:MAG TPA: hypothetical protein VHE81_00085 [Lacipirellulaceae bacterium]|nr:hypothetical protein [Lacipirellulaceae bacterium]